MRTLYYAAFTLVLWSGTATSAAADPATAAAANVVNPAAGIVIGIPADRVTETDGHPAMADGRDPDAEDRTDADVDGDIDFTSSDSKPPEILQRDLLAFALPRPGDALVGEERVARLTSRDTFVDIGYRYGLGYRELTLANPNIDPWLPADDTLILLPTRFLLPDAPQEGLVLNAAEMRLYYYPPEHPDTVITFPVSVGRDEWQTPVGETVLQSRITNPIWYPPASIREEHAAAGDVIPAAVGPGPDNPLGAYALNLALPGYLIHGTNRPYGIGMPVTHGCIRLHPVDIKFLHDDVTAGMRVTLVNQPYKVGWHDDVLYLEAHPTLDDDERGFDAAEVLQAIEVTTALENRSWYNRDHALRVAQHPDGVPHAIGRRIRDSQVASATRP